MSMELGHRWSRRGLLGAGGAAALALAAPLSATAALWSPAAQDEAESLAIDLAVEPPTLDPALIYDNDGWSVVHSVYDALVQLGEGGSLEMVLAEAMTQSDPLTWEIRLRSDITFHNGEPLDAAAVAFSVAHILDPETGSQIAGNFQVIERVEEVDPLTVRFHLSAPAPWLPSQMAPWLAILPPLYASDPANDRLPTAAAPQRLPFSLYGAAFRAVRRRASAIAAR